MQVPQVFFIQFCSHSSSLGITALFSHIFFCLLPSPCTCSEKLSSTEGARSPSWLLKFCCASIVMLPMCTAGAKLAASGSFSQRMSKLSWRDSSADSCYYPDLPTQRIKCFDLVLSLCSFKTSQRIC